MHWVSPELPLRERERLAERQSGPLDLLVIWHPAQPELNVRRAPVRRARAALVSPVELTGPASSFAVVRYGRRKGFLSSPPR
jgi:hypothetical protein